MLNGRKRTASVLATLCITAVSGSMLTASPTFAEPDIDDVQARVDSLFEKAEQASERYNDARIELDEAQQRLDGLHADLARQQEKVDAVRTEVAAAVVSQYQGQALSTTTQVLLADDPDAFLDQLATVSGYNDQQTEMMADFAVQAQQLEMREAAAERELGRIAATKKTLAEEKAEIDDKADEAQELLDRLEERAATAASRSRTSTAAPVDLPDVAVSGRAGAAVQYALGQVGDSYVYGSAGPSSFDCSGLTMMAWAQAGVGLPHSSGAQMGSGSPVSQSQLAPGDLVFYYSPVSHVGIYIGNGQIVHAANPSTGVQIAPVFSMPYSGAVRPG
ncbi:MAG: NlpC/P60 family protein [Nocardioides sp.]